MKHRFFASTALLVGMGMVPSLGQAVPISLNFENIAPYPNGNNVLINGFYNGGTSSIGTSGPNLGVGFSDNALLICLNTIGTSCSNTSRGGLGDPNSQKGSLFFLSGIETFMNVAAGFDTGFSFNYTAVNQGGSVTAFDGLGGTGNQLGTLNLGLTASTCTGLGSFCPFVTTFLAFAGTAKSIAFSGVANQIVFDDVTFGKLTPGPSAVPLPAGLPLLATGIAALVAGRRLRKRNKSA